MGFSCVIFYELGRFLQLKYGEKNDIFTHGNFLVNYMLNKNTLGVKKCKANQKQHC